MSGKYILIVDDDPDLVETVAMMLESKGFEVGKAYDGIEGEEAIKKRRPDVLILDVMMPRKNGYELCKELKSNKWTQEIPVILLTAVGEAVPTTSYSHADGMSRGSRRFYSQTRGCGHSGGSGTKIALIIRHDIRRTLEKFDRIRIGGLKVLEEGACVASSSPWEDNRLGPAVCAPLARHRINLTFLTHVAGDREVMCTAGHSRGSCLSPVQVPGRPPGLPGLAAGQPRFWPFIPTTSAPKLSAPSSEPWPGPGW